MRKLLFAIIGILFALPAFAQNFNVQDVNRFTGAVLEPGITSHTTYDSVDFGFRSKYVRLCLRADSATTYIRFGNATTTSQDALATSAAGNRMTVPVSTSDSFINGVSGVMDNNALPFASPSSADTLRPAPTCVTQPWQTNGIVIHIVSGQATMDVWAF